MEEDVDESTLKIIFMDTVKCIVLRNLLDAGVISRSDFDLKINEIIKDINSYVELEI